MEKQFTDQKPLNIQKIIASVERLTPMPTSATRVIKALEEPYVGATTISELIGLDQALAANVLQMANSVLFGYSGNCSSLNQAVVRLGFQCVKMIVLGAASFSTLNKSLAGYNFKHGELWNHSVSTGMAAQWLSRTLRVENPEEAYVAGLLHDIGKVLLDQYVVLDQKLIIEKMQKDKKGLWEVEAIVYGVDHAGIGAMMAKKWNFPENLVEAIRYHHAPALTYEKGEMASLINVANSFVVRLDIGVADLYAAIIHPESLRILKINDKDASSLKSKMFKAFGLNPD
ncbi:MAG TPA: HDOD domain-containing protein [Anaerolineaceae bacterium]|nr:HDOD domain-containing protein [Anaerolineaceae bacterium]